MNIKHDIEVWNISIEWIEECNEYKAWYRSMNISIEVWNKYNE